MDHDGIARLAALARLDIKESEREQFAAQLTDILRYVDQLQAVDTSAVEASSHPLPQSAAWREDMPIPSLTTAEGLANAPDADLAAGLFRVPKVIG
jgi:aspartyl-tRNA(Asn)/glutamyl-tRNA(Gln) amidotransferase subunit C